MGEPQKFRKRAIVVEAMQFVAPTDDDEGSWRALKEWGAPVMRVAGWGAGDHVLQLYVEKGGSVCTLDPGDWVIKEGDASGFYPCADAIFANTYEPTDVGVYAIASELSRFAVPPATALVADAPTPDAPTPAEVEAFNREIETRRGTHQP